MNSYNLIIYLRTALFSPGNCSLSASPHLYPPQQPIPPTLTPSPTLPPPPTGTAVIKPPTGFCLTAYDDINGDGIHQAGEPLLANIAFTLFNEQNVIINYISDGFSEPRCFENMAPGSYQITRSTSAQERLTTPGNRAILIQAGTIANLQFGSTRDETRHHHIRFYNGGAYTNRIAFRGSHRGSVASSGEYNVEFSTKSADYNCNIRIVACRSTFIYYHAANK